MAINVSKAKTSREGNNLNSYYGRLETTILADGVTIEVEVTYYQSKGAFQSGRTPIDRSYKYEFSYNRKSEGTDVLSLAHDKLIAEKVVSEGFDQSELAKVDL